MTLTPESSPILIQPDFAFAYDSAGNVGTITHSVLGGSSLATFSYAYDAANRLTHETNAEGSVTYTYDNTNQLTSATGARSESYAHDANGNRNTTGYTVGTGGTLSASPNATYTYDSAGHMTAKTDTATGKITTFAYDYSDRLTGATRKTSGGLVDYQVTYTYDALNRRIGEQIDADGAGSGTPVQTWTLFDGQNPYADFTGSGTLKDRYLYGPAVDALLARTDASGVTNWYLSDRLGSVRDIVDVSGNVVYHTGYDSFGNKVSSSGSGGDRFGFTGREHDAALNLYYNRARFYDPATGRFLSRDPIGFSAGDANLYRYVGNGPTDGTDPSGLAETWPLPIKTKDNNTWPPILMPGPGHSIGELPSSDQIVNSLEFQTFAQAIMARAREGSNNSVRETGGVVLYDYRTGGYHFIHYPYRGDRTSIKLYPLPNIPIRKSPIDRKKVEPIGIPVAIIHSHPDPHQVKNGVGPSNLDVTNSQQPYPGNDNTSQNFFKGRVFPWYIIGKDLADGIYGVWVVNPGGIVTGPHKSPAPPIVNFK